MQISEFNIASNKLSLLNETDVVSLTGVIIDEPAVKDFSQSVKIKVDNYGDTILVTTNLYPEYKYLDKVEITGKLETPMETQDFSYKNYLLKDRIYSVMYFPKISAQGALPAGRQGPASGGKSKKISPNITQIIYSKILWVKGKMRQSIQSNFLPPQSSVLEGMILGDNNAISKDIKDGFRVTGLSHIIAVSGQHIVILSTILMSFLLFLGLRRNQAFYLSAVFICIYIVLVGLPSSGIRAAVMGIIYLLGQALGRQTMSSRIIVLAGAVMLLFNPLLLFYDIGFQLSFLAVLGLIYLEPVIREFLKFLIKMFFKKDFKSKYEGFLMMVSATLAAQIFTLPIIVYNFGNISFVSPLTNLLVLPAVYGIMLFGFLSSLAGTVVIQLGWILFLPCYFLLKYFLWVADIFSKPWAYKIVSNVSWVWLAFSYLFLGAVTRYFSQKLRTKFLDF